MKAVARIARPTHERGADATSGRPISLARAAWAVLLGLGIAPLQTTIAQRVSLAVRPRSGDTLHVALEHTITLTGGPRGSPDTPTTISTTYRILMERMRDRTLPGFGSAPTEPAGTLRATFRLDSLTETGDRAWVSLRGRVEQVSSQRGADPGQMSGTLTGLLVLDRRRGWLAEWRALHRH